MRQIEPKLTAGRDVATACRSIGFSDATYDNWRKRSGSMARAKVSDLKSFQNWCRFSKPSWGSFGRRNNVRRKKTIVELALDKLILKRARTIQSRGSR